ncbi:PQQ-dependent sugar dehydrogenase [Streptomyces sp. H27-D2]|uniref:PQQ-dependent sugar dehydrogenase n=1 Tax=Streptomyces sp. H27-D2 TaxID=3046304 RepID=UPI002DBB05FD|nr:PQQ-dependent sugar dehydrogenase [Streptomyces sp. H27-D2]MEC4016237.1 PQQ-dependent sugar dehydrogenase [Streptomyces sp. H27-D2]
MRRPVVTAALAAAALLLAAGCSSDEDGAGRPARSSSSSPGGAGADGESSSPAEPPSSPAPAKGSVKVERTLTENLDSPWGLAPLPNGDLLIASRDSGKILRISADDGKKTELGSVPGVSASGEGGLLGLALAPAFGADHMVYAYFTTASDNRIARMSYDDKKPAGSQLGAPDTIFKGIPKGEIHNGGRIAFGPDKMLYAGAGETGDRGLAQDKESPAGKILRMTPEGEPAHGNPEADSVVYSYGHRNVQGLAWDAQKHLWASEFGQDAWDELNLIEPGKNYGWPLVEGRREKAGYVEPVEQWKTADASPSGIAFAKGSIWMAGLRGERLWRIPLDGTKPVAEPQAFLNGKYGRLRTVVATEDGGLWLVTNETDSRGTPEKGDDRILRLEVS